MNKWYRVALFNLFLLALLGLLIRYKINFPLPFLEQKKLLHAHSHFAFNGWIGFLLQIVILDHFTTDYRQHKKAWDRFLFISAIVNYAMIISFAWSGYSAVSIILSTIALWLSYYFAFRLYRLLPADKRVSVHFIKAALFFLLLSSLGPYALAVLMSMKPFHEYWNHNALYFFLHFQYNGWFLFAVFGLLMKKIEDRVPFHRQHARRFFLLLLITCIPSYFLTVLWHDPPSIITVMNICTVVVQAVALYYFWKLLGSNISKLMAPLPLLCRWLYACAVISFNLKVVLQLISAHPALGQLAFGFRPIIIGYLHLIFLVIVSLFLLSALAEQRVIPLIKKTARLGLIIFSAGVIVNEALLAIQGVASIFYIFLPSVNLILFANTLVMAAGAGLIWQSASFQSPGNEPLIATM